MDLRKCYGLLSVFGPGMLAVFSLFLWNFSTLLDDLPKPLNKILPVLFILSSLDYAWSIGWWSVYKSTEVVSEPAALPSVTVVVPVYNESLFVRHTLYSILRSEYPRDRLEVVVVDDGSIDDSWEHIGATKHLYHNTGISYRTLRHKKNLGKRFAIQSGFRLASGEVIVTLDSDSVLESTSLLALISPLVRCRHVGGVAGHLSVLNVENKLIPRLLDILFDMSGNIPRAAQSCAGGAVSILPGALSAYRAVAIKPVLTRLSNTTFMGTTIKHGEDVEMTLELRHAGWSTVYQSNAVVHTTVPETVKKAFLTYIRWERSSYIYLLSGHLQLAATAVITRLRDRQSQSKGANQKRPLISCLGEQIEFQPTLAGSFFLLLNLVSTATSNLMLPFVVYLQARSVLVRPWLLFLNFVAVFLASGFRHLLFVADVELHSKSPAGIQVNSEVSKYRDYQRISDAYRTPVDSKECAGKLEGPSVFDRRSRLLWRLQYGALATLFHATIICWSSFVALATLRSQSWLTR